MASKRNHTLIAYLTIPDTLAPTAQKLAELTGGYLFPLEPAKPYLPKDFEPDRPRARTRWEAKSFSDRPSIRDRLYFMDEYTTIYLGLTHWWYGIPRLTQSFLEEYDFTGKLMIPFTTRATPGAEELPGRVSILAEAYPIPDWTPLHVLADDMTEEDLRTWLDSFSRRRRRRRQKNL